LQKQSSINPEQQGQFQSFEQFFQSGVWKQILQQMQQDEGQGQGPEQQQGIGSLGPEPMQQQTPMPNRMGAQYGGRMGYQGGEMVEGMTEGIEKVGRGGSEIIEGMTEGVEKLRPGSVDIIEKIKESVAPFMDEATWIEKLIEYLRRKRREGRPNQGSPSIMDRAITDTEVEDAYGVSMDEGIESLRGRS
jgi:hypothetical protein